MTLDELRTKFPQHSHLIDLCGNEQDFTTFNLLLHNLANYPLHDHQTRAAMDIATSRHITRNGREAIGLCRQADATMTNTLQQNLQRHGFPLTVAAISAIAEEAR